MERLAADFVARDGYLRPFAERALAIVREDEALLARAVKRFDSMSLPWRAAQTERLVAGS